MIDAQQKNIFQFMFRKVSFISVNGIHALFKIAVIVGVG
jgi:hypothetical protein